MVVWGSGLVTQFASRSSSSLGARRVICIDDVPERLAMAAKSGAETVNYREVHDLLWYLNETTSGRGPDACIDAVGMEAHGDTIGAYYDLAKSRTGMATDRPNAMRQAI